MSFRFSPQHIIPRARAGVLTSNTMKTLSKILAALALLLALAGCSTPVVVDPTAANRETLITPQSAVPAVRLSTQLATLENDVSDFGFKFRAQSGKVFRQVFTGGEDAPAMLDLVNVNISKSSSDLMILATKTQIVFQVSVSLRAADGQKHVLSSTGVGSTAWSIDRAMREAMEKAVLDLGKQVEAILKS